MDSPITRIDDVTRDWITDRRRASGALRRGSVTGVEKDTSIPFGSIVSRLTLTYSSDAPASTPARLFFKLSNRSQKTQSLNAASEKSCFIRPCWMSRPTFRSRAVMMPPGMKPRGNFMFCWKTSLRLTTGLSHPSRPHRIVPSSPLTALPIYMPISGSPSGWLFHHSNCLSLTAVGQRNTIPAFAICSTTTFQQGGGCCSKRSSRLCPALTIGWSTAAL